MTPPSPLLLRFVPALDALRGYSLRALRADAVAGLTVAAVAVPQAMAYAMIAGLPPQYGLYTAIVMTAVGALLDSSRQLINGPTNAISIAVLSALAAVPEAERIQAAVLLALLVGLVQTAIAALGLGRLIRHVSHAVIAGFTAGAAILIILDQLKHLLGLAAVGGAADHFLTRFWLTLTHGGPVHGPTLLVGVGTAALIVGLHRLGQRWGVRLPAFLAALALVSLLAWAWGLDGHGVRVVGAIPAELPAFAVPAVQWHHVRELAGSAGAIALLGLLEAVAMAQAIAVRTGQKIDVTQQCLGEGVANLAGSFFQCFPGSGSLTRSALNQQAGAVSQWSGVILAGAVAAVVLLFAPLAHWIPKAALAGILLVTACRLIDVRQLLAHARASRFDAAVVLTTAVSAVAVSVEFCILIGVALCAARHGLDALRTLPFSAPCSPPARQPLAA